MTASADLPQATGLHERAGHVVLATPDDHVEARLDDLEQASSCSGAYDRSASVNAIVLACGGEHACPHRGALASIRGMHETRSAPAAGGVGRAVGRSVIDDDELDAALDVRQRRTHRGNS